MSKAGRGYRPFSRSDAQHGISPINGSGFPRLHESLAQDLGVRFEVVPLSEDLETVARVVAIEPLSSGTAEVLAFAHEPRVIIRHSSSVVELPWSAWRLRTSLVIERSLAHLIMSYGLHLACDSIGPDRTLNIYSRDLSLRDYLHGVTGEYAGHRPELPSDCGHVVGIDEVIESTPTQTISALMERGEFDDDGAYRLQLLPGIEGERALLFLRLRGPQGKLQLRGRILADRELEMALVSLMLDHGERIFAHPISSGTVSLYSETCSLQHLVEQVYQIEGAENRG